MYPWQKHLRGDPLPWLLEPENPSIRFWTLTDLLGCPLDSPEAQEARAAIAGQPLVQQIFALQHPAGYWGKDETKPHTAEGAVTALELLRALGVEPDARTRAGCDSLLKNSQHPCGGLSMIRTTRSGIFPCTTGEHLPALVYFGLGDDPRVRAAFAFVIEEFEPANALDCGRYQHQSCLWGAIAALNGLAALPAELRGERSQRVVARLAEALLGAQLDFAGEHKRWLTFGVPRAWDLLSALKALALNGYANDPRFAPLLQRVLDRQDAQGPRPGCWPCGSVSRTWPLEKRGAPSKWVTLDALRVIKWAGD